MHRREAHPEKDVNLEQLALQQLNLIDIQIIAVVDPYENQNQHEVPIPPTITDPFWREFNDWRRNNPQDYDQWLNNRDQLPSGDIAPENVDTNNATGDNAPRTNNVRNENNIQTTGSTCGESFTSDILTITSTGDSCITSLTGGSFTAESYDSFHTANENASTSDSFITCPEIQSPPESLLSFCNEFDVSHSHRKMILPGVRIWPTAKSVPRKHKTKPTAALDDYIKQLSLAGKIEPSKRGPFIASLFIIPKQNNEPRLIVDYSNLTPVLKPPKFYLPSIYQLLRRKQFPFVDPFFIKIDLKNAFYNIALAEQSRYITTFYYKKYYRFKYLPFGLSIAPFFMQLVTNYISKYFNENGCFSWVHLDDLIAISDDKPLLIAVLRTVLEKLKKSKILINTSKSSLIPSKQIEFLGALWKATKIERLPKVDEQINNILNFINNTRKSYSLKKAQQIAGYLKYYLAIAGNSVYKVVTFYLHNFSSFSSYKQWWSLAIRKLIQIKVMLYNRQQIIESCSIQHIIHSDSSLTTAAVYHVQADYVQTQPLSYRAPIYVGEIHAAFNALKYIYFHHKNNPSEDTAYQLFTDNSIVYFLLNRGRGRLTKINNFILIQIIVFFTIIVNYINVSVYFVPSRENLADEFTRLDLQG
jgi:hypothetical protein